MAPRWTLAIEAARYSPWLDCGSVQVLAAPRPAALGDLRALTRTSSYDALLERSPVVLAARGSDADLLDLAVDVDLAPEQAAWRCRQATDGMDLLALRVTPLGKRALCGIGLRADDPVAAVTRVVQALAPYTHRSR